MRSLAFVVVACCSSCLLGTGPRSSWSPFEQQKQIARNLEPEALPDHDSHPVNETLGVIRVRAYVDDAMRASVDDADDRVTATVADASAILSTQLGVSLELASVRAFQAQSGDLRNDLRQLRQLDNAGDVDVVVAFIGAAPFVTDQLHDLGWADVLGHHAVVRILDDARENAAIETALNRISASETRELLERRRRHKAAVVLLHEIAHALGGVHAGETRSVLFPIYSPDQDRIDDDTAALLPLGVAWHRATNEPDRVAAIGKLVDEIKRRRAHLDAHDFDAQIAILERRAGRDAKPADVAHDDGAAMKRVMVHVAPEDSAAFDEAIALANKGDDAGAWAKLAPIAAKKDADPTLLSAACLMCSSDRVVALDGKARCERALSASPDDIAPAVGAARFAMRAQDAAAEERAFDEAAARLARAKAPPVDVVVALADAAAFRGRLTLAEDALAKVDGSAVVDARDRVAHARHRAGLKRGAVVAKDEPAVADAARAIEKTSENDVDGAKKLASEAVVRFGHVAGLDAARCELLWRARDLDEAEKACTAALEKDDDAAVAHIFAGIIQEERGKHDRAVGEIEHALKLDPETKATWTLLATVLRRAHRPSAYADLEKRYRDQFGGSLAEAH